MAEDEWFIRQRVYYTPKDGQETLFEKFLESRSWSTAFETNIVNNIEDALSLTSSPYDVKLGLGILNGIASAYVNFDFEPFKKWQPKPLVISGLGRYAAIPAIDAFGGFSVFAKYIGNNVEYYVFNPRNLPVDVSVESGSLMLGYQGQKLRFEPFNEKHKIGQVTAYSFNDFNKLLQKRDRKR